MSKFEPRLTTPSSTDKRYINYKYGGISICDAIDRTGLVMPNCVGYAHGRMLELINAKVPNWKIPAGNAEDFMDIAVKNGMKTGLEPRLGAIIVWSSGQKHNWTDGAGHVGVVEAITSDGTITVSMSAFNGYIFRVEKVKKPYVRGNYNFEGFVYPPVDFGTGDYGTLSSPVKEDYSCNTIPNRFKVKLNGKQINAYTTFSYACREADKTGGIVIDGNTGLQIYPAEVKEEIEEKKELTDTSYPNYTGDDVYRVRLAYTDENHSIGSYQFWRNAYKNWLANKDMGYHVYDKDGNRLD